MTTTLRFNLGDVRLRDEERRQLQKLSRKLIELKIPSDRKPSDPRALSRCARISLGRGGSRKCLRLLGKDRWGSSLPINRHFFEIFLAQSRAGRSARMPATVKRALG